MLIGLLVMVVLGPLGAVLGVTMIACLFESRRDEELRSRTAELLAAALRRELPLGQALAAAVGDDEPGGDEALATGGTARHAPSLARLASWLTSWASGERKRRRALRQMLASLADGAPLSEALGKARSVFPGSVTDAIAAAEGWGPAALADALDQVAQESQAAPTTHEWLAWSLVYPALLLFLSGLTSDALFGLLADVFAEPISLGYETPLSLWGTVEGSTRATFVVALVLLGGTVGLLLYGPLLANARRARGLVEGSLARLPGLAGVLRLGATARLARALVAPVRREVALHVALAQVAPAASFPPTELAARRAAQALEAGAPMGEAILQCGLAPPFGARLAAAAGAGPQRFASSLGAVAAEADERRATIFARLLGASYPVGVLLVALVLAMQWTLIFDLSNLVGWLSSPEVLW